MGNVVPDSIPFMELKPLLELLPIILPLAVKWVEREERKIVTSGVPLSLEGLMDASRMGVAHPEKIRLMRVDRIPILNGWFMKSLSRAIVSNEVRTRDKDR